MIDDELHNLMLQIIDDDEVDDVHLDIEYEADVDEWLKYVINLIEAVDLKDDVVEIAVILAIDIKFIDLLIVEFSKYYVHMIIDV